MSLRDRLRDYKDSELLEFSGEAPGWASPSIDLMSKKPIVALDQSLSNTGYVVMHASPDYTKIEIFEKGTIQPKSGLSSFNKNYEQGNILAEELYRLLCYVPCFAIAHEMPAVFGHRTDSSLLAGFAVQREADRRKIPCTMYSAQQVRRVLGGPGCKSKDDIKPILKQYVDDVDTRKWNEHTRDALAIGLVHSIEMRSIHGI